MSGAWSGYRGEEPLGEGGARDGGEGYEEKLEGKVDGGEGREKGSRKVCEGGGSESEER